MNRSNRRSMGWLEDARRDCLYAVRTLSRAPAFTAVAVLTLALGIGAVTVIYSVVHHVLIAPLPYRNADRLVNVFVEDSQSSRIRGGFSAPELLEFRDGAAAFEDVIGTLGQGMRYETPDAVESLRGVWVTPNFFDFMGIEPLLGRAIGPADAAPDAAAVVVLRHRAWVRYFAGDPRVIGSTILLNGERRTIVGVMPPRFTWHAADLWMPSALEGLDHGATTVRNFQARLKPGVTVSEAEAQLDAIARGRARDYPKDYPERFQIKVLNVIEYTVGPFSGVLYTALAAVGLLLLIACCNVANMLLARATTREREMMIRSALGAGRGRIVRQLMIESVLLAAGGAALGCLVAYAGIEALVPRLPQGPLPGEVEITLNAPVLAFSLGAAALSAVLFGLTPALFTTRRDLVDGLKAAGRSTTGRSGHLRNALVVAEIALSVVLVLSAGLLIRSFLAVMSVDLGFNPEKLLVVSVNFPPGRYTTAAHKQRFYGESLERIASLAGVTAAAATGGIPPFNAGSVAAVEVPGEPAPADTRVAVQPVTADYFRTIGLRFVRGDRFADLTLAGAAQQAVVNQRFVAQYLAGRDPVGRTIRLLPAGATPDPARQGVFEITGVVADVRNQGLREPAGPQVYLPWSGADRAYPLIMVRTAGDPATAINAIRQELSRIDRQVVALQPTTVWETLDRSFYAQPRFSLLLLAVFGGTGTVLVAIGIFSVMAYTVSRQKKEIALRLALGASRAHVSGMVLRLGARLLACGGAVGLLASVAAARVLSNQLWNVSPHDPLTLAATVTLVSIVALAACYLPARRAMRVEPIGALREE